MKRNYVLGLGLWRGGLILVVSYGAFRSFRRILSITDPQLELAIAVGLTGLALVFVSLIAERIEDEHAETELRE